MPMVGEALVSGSEGVASHAEDAAFEAFYASEYAAVVRFAFALVGKLGVAEEIVQEAFLAAFRDWYRIAEYEQPAAWVRRVVANRGVSVWRRWRTEALMLGRL